MTNTFADFCDAHALSHEATTVSSAESACCPRCGNARLFRVRRRLDDRVLSLIRPVFRFRCDRVECQWQGVLPQRYFTGRSWQRPQYCRRYK